MNIKSISIIAALSLSASAASATPYYLFDGDSAHAVEINNGAVVASFNTFGSGYPPAITNTIWLGGRDNTGARQYTLNGVATGATSAGGPVISQILDGTTNGVNNYGVTCCSSAVVTIANADWSNQRVLFSLANAGTGGSGIAYDTNTHQLYVSLLRAGTIQDYSLNGQLLNTFSVGVSDLAGLAYDQSTDTLWGWDRGSSALDQFSTSGALLQHEVINVSSFGIGNPFGGEMAISAAVPEPSTWAMMILGFAGIGFMAYRRKSNPVSMAA
jgi:hypothetical protein